MLKRKLNTLAFIGLVILLVTFYHVFLAFNNERIVSYEIKQKNNQRRKFDEKETDFKKKISQSTLSKINGLLEEAMQWQSQSRDQKLSTLLSNPVYRNLRIRKPQEDYVKKKVNLLLIVSSGPRRFDRRKGIRQTWWKDCKPTNGVVPACLFFTDLQQPGDELYSNITKEQEMYGDMYFQRLRGGMEFGVRFLYHMVWSKIYYDFDYFLRIDDDYFFCLERFLYELPTNPPLTEFHWGYTHCIMEMTRPEESLILFSRDVIETFLLQDPEKIRCHPFADQMIGVWVAALKILTLFRHDERVHHAPVVSEVPELRKVQQICHKYMGIHGTYQQDMELFWKNRGRSVENFTSAKERYKKIGNLEENSNECVIPHYLNFLRFEPEWQYEPKECLYGPSWDTGRHKIINGVYAGRQEDQHLVKEDVKIFGRKM